MKRAALLFVSISVGGALLATQSIAQTFDVYIQYVSGPCGRAANTKYTLTVSGTEVTGKAEAGSGFTAKVEQDGSFKASFESFSGRNPLLAEGNVTRRYLKIVNVKQGCVFESK